MPKKSEAKKDYQEPVIEDNIPPSVKAAAAAAEALHKSIYNPDPAPAEPAADPVTLEGNEPAPAPAEPAPAPAPVAKAADDWEHKFNSMRGRFERSDTANRKLQERLTGLEQVIATMQEAPAAPTELDAASLLTAAEREAYGEEFINTVGKVARQNVSPEVAQLKNEVKNLQSQLKSVGTQIGQSARDRMHADLTAALPNWLEVNNNPDFLDWLALPDAYSGAIKHELLKAAYADNDGPRVLNFFKGFLSEEAALVPPTNTAPAAEIVAKVPLASLAAPGRAKTAAAPNAPAEKPFFTRAQVSRFYVDVANRKYVGREEEKNRIDIQIVEAGREGRIRG